MTQNKKALNFAAEQVLRLGGQDFFPVNDLVLDNLVKSLVHYAESEAHIELMISTWIGETRQMLHPSQVAELAQRTGTQRPIAIGCAKCGGTGWLLTTRVVTRVYDDQTVETFNEDCVKRCTCERGRQLAPLVRAQRELFSEVKDVLKTWAQ